MRSHMRAEHAGVPLPQTLIPCGAKSGIPEVKCTLAYPSVDSLRVHRTHCPIWQAAHAADVARPTKPPETGNVQETLEHLLYECRCPEVVRLRHEYAKTFSAPSVGEWLTSYHSARYVFAALDVLAQWKVRAAKQLADAAASGALPPPLAPGASSSTQSINILRRPVQKSRVWTSEYGLLFAEAR